jgi:hypothetical protein
MSGNQVSEKWRRLSIVTGVAAFFELPETEV